MFIRIEALILIFGFKLHFFQIFVFIVEFLVFLFRVLILLLLHLHKNPSQVSQNPKSYEEQTIYISIKFKICMGSTSCLFRKGG